MEPMEVLRRAIQTRLGERMVSMSSTLVETVSINYEDFNESFLTCGTCLCMYDGSEHTPKLLQCSHTVCLHCLTRIAASQTRDTGTFRCPICRELITIPRGGVSALPPSFLVNQLLDLMSRQRREVIPKCSVHINQELLFCETCDTVFCTLCTEGSHNDTSGTSCEHTIIPFSIAIKRMSEILLYKANECISKLTQAQEGVNSELERLDSAAVRCIEQVNSTFQQVSAALESRRLEMVAAVNSSCQEKRRVLEEQQALIDAEKSKVEQECEGLQYQVEVRNITQRISSLSEKLDAASTLGEPRENAFLTCDFTHNECLNTINTALKTLGRVRTSTTFPSLCSAQLDPNTSTVAGLEATILLTTVDYHGAPRHNGGDPIKAEIVSIGTEQSSLSTGTQLKIHVVDIDDGSYKIHFRPPTPGRYVAKISVLDRPIRDCPLFFNVTEHNNPVCVYGCRGSGKDEFLQPVAVAFDTQNNLVYVVDTGNSRIKVLNSDLEFIKHIENDGLNGRSCTGIAISQAGLVIVNWRSKCVTEMNISGETLKTFSHNEFQEPIDIAVDTNYGHILVADNGVSSIFIFDCDGKILFQVGKKGTFNLISSVTVGLGGEILVADSRIQVFSAKGDFTEEIFSEGKGKGRYGGVTVDSEGRILASRSEKGRNFVQILASTSGQLLGSIDSYESRLKRPSGLAVTNDNHLIVVDLGNDCIKKYRYCNSKLATEYESSC
ncbi:tripartite motif-containing protein 2-like isoform X2 [Chrysoperla carnea]|uniref:tripartite motif-containing protein 2-like isoform X2 n=1 Tax=Chrysoperla carnea TaxID=189513 RepID=UPI001D075EB8|nr:tripartite motif-containing protein 2-like isoform X2 [Chrysoperla carnea]